MKGWAHKFESLRKSVRNSNSIRIESTRKADFTKYMFFRQIRKSDRKESHFRVAFKSIVYRNRKSPKSTVCPLLFKYLSSPAPVVRRTTYPAFRSSNRNIQPLMLICEHAMWPTRYLWTLAVLIVIRVQQYPSPHVAQWLDLSITLQIYQKIKRPQNMTFQICKEI